MQKPYQPNKHSQSGMISLINMVVVLVILFMGTVVAPTVKTIIQNRNNLETNRNSGVLDNISANLLRSSIMELSGADTMVLPPMGVNHSNDLTRLDLPDEYIELVPVGMVVRYCPYDLKSLTDHPGNGRLGNPYVDSYDTGNAPTLGNRIVFSVILQPDTFEDKLTCKQVLSGKIASGVQVKSIKLAEAISRITSNKTEDVTLSTQECPVGKEMQFIPRHLDATGNLVESKFDCVRSVRGIAATEGQDSCPKGGAIVPKGADSNGIDCATITADSVQNVKATGQTLLPLGGDSNLITPTLVTMTSLKDFFFKAKSPVSSDSDIATLPAINDTVCTPGVTINMPDGSQQSVPGGFAIVQQDGSIKCVNAVNYLNQRSYGVAACPNGKKVIWRPGNNAGKTFMCEGYAANDPNYGQFNICSNSQYEMFGYAPETNSIYCLYAPTGQATFNQDVTYAKRSTSACITNGVVMLQNNVANCSRTYQSYLDSAVKGLAGYVQNYALNWDPTNKVLVPTNPGVVIYTYNALIDGPIANGDMPTSGDETTQGQGNINTSNGGTMGGTTGAPGGNSGAGNTINP